MHVNSNLVWVCSQFWSFFSRKVVQGLKGLIFYLRISLVKIGLVLCDESLSVFAEARVLGEQGVPLFSFEESWVGSKVCVESSDAEVGHGNLVSTKPSTVGKSCLERIKEVWPNLTKELNKKILLVLVFCEFVAGGVLNNALIFFCNAVDPVGVHIVLWNITVIGTDVSQDSKTLAQLGSI
jgi:hypothetical protein